MNFWQILFLALVLDFFIGEPDQLWKRYPHPAVLMGRVIQWFDTKLNRAPIQLIAGFATMILTGLAALVIGYALHWLPDFGVIELAVVAILLAHRSLVDHVGKVADSLMKSTQQGREAVALIVGRNPSEMDESAVSAAAIESAAENFSDGVVAPIFWYLIPSIIMPAWGLAGLLLYKVVNTADSMIGHQTDQYARFGFAAAKLDDAMNWVPARITGGLFCLVARSQDAFDIMKDDAPLHRSPNAGWPEAAMAGILNVRLSGPRSYGGVLSDEVYINTGGERILSPDSIRQSLVVLYKAWLVLAGVSGFFALLTLIF